MKTIQLKSMTLTNFKGVRSKTIQFGPETFIFGANGTGKTTLFDAFTWLLFGKDSTDRTAFEIKTLDQDNNPIPKIDHEVEAVIEVDGEVVELKRVFREKWVTRRGSTEHHFAGNETLYFWNDVPMTQRDYTAKVGELVDEKVFKLITSPVAFNSLKWQDQREELLAMSGGVTNEDVALGNKDFEDLLSRSKGKTIEEYEKQIKASIKKSKDVLKAIPTRIDEVEKGKPESQDWKALEAQMEALSEELNAIDGQIEDKAKAQEEVEKERRDLQSSIYKYERVIEDAKHQAKIEADRIFQEESQSKNILIEKIKSISYDLDKAKRTRDRLYVEREDLRQSIKSLSEKNDEIRAEWHQVNARTFKMDPEDCKCPTCKREFEEADIAGKKAELETNFNARKKRDLDSLNNQGQINANKIKDLEKEVEELAARITKGEGIIKDFYEEVKQLEEKYEEELNQPNKRSREEILSQLLKSDGTIPENQKKIEELKEVISELKLPDTTDLKERKTQIGLRIKYVDKQLVTKTQIEDADARIEQLKKEESQLAQAIADLEKDQYTIEQFTKAKMDRLESLINDRFKLVKFKLFEQQVNGGEVPTCKAMVDGVPFSDLNTASRINAGLDIINTLCDYYGVTAPIFIDNRESVVELIDSKSQIINLVVSGADESLRVEAKETAEMF